MVDRTKLGRRCSRRPSYTRTRGGAECGSPPETTAANISCPQIISGSRSRRLSSDAVAQKCRGSLLPTTRRVCGIGPTFWYAQPGDAIGIPSRRRVASRLTRSRLEVAPNQPSFPLGMPIRVGLVLRNLTNVVIPTPASLSLKSAFVRAGSSMQQAWRGPSFRSSSARLAFRRQTSIRPRRTRAHSPAEPNGDLFPGTRSLRIVVDVRWHGPNKRSGVLIDLGVSSKRAAP
jgi:hypothetical protein